MNFPEYRRYKNGHSYFKIISNQEFYEFKKLVNRLEKFHIKAEILPDRNYIQDMLSDYEMHWEKIEEKDFIAFVEAYS